MKNSGENPTQAHVKQSTFYYGVYPNAVYDKGLSFQIF